MREGPAARVMSDWVTAKTFSAIAYEDCSTPLFNPIAENALSNSCMLLDRTGSEQLIRARADERSNCVHRLTGVRRGRNRKAKFGIHAKVHLHSVMICNIVSGCITQSSGDCITTGTWQTMGSMKQAISP